MKSKTNISLKEFFLKEFTALIRKLVILMLFIGILGFVMRISPNSPFSLNVDLNMAQIGVILFAALAVFFLRPRSLAQIIWASIAFVSTFLLLLILSCLGASQWSMNFILFFVLGLAIFFFLLKKQ